MDLDDLVDDDDNEEELDEEETPDPPAPKRKRGRPTTSHRIPPPQTATSGTLEDDDPEGLDAERQRFEYRLEHGYSMRLPRGTPKATGIIGWDQEYAIIERHGLTHSGRIIFHRLKPPGVDGKPMQLGSVYPAQLAGNDEKTPGECMFEYLVDEFADPAREVLIGWTYHDRVRLRTGEMALPIKRAPAPRRADAAPGVPLSSPPNRVRRGTRRRLDFHSTRRGIRLRATRRATERRRATRARRSRDGSSSNSRRHRRRCRRTCRPRSPRT